jgi:site-specific recombinase XerC
VPTKSGDDAFLETYLRHAGVTGHFEREARAVWAVFRTLTDGKRLADCDRDDGRALVAHYESLGLKTATVQKKLMWLNAAVNLAIKEGKPKFNPFSGVVPKPDKQTRRLTRRLPLDDADIKNAKRNLGKLDDGDALLFRVLATTGMRLSEAFEIDGEQKERGASYSRN